VAIVMLVAFGVYRARRVESVPAVDFVDDLKGPTSSNLRIPFDVYTLTPEGLLRSKAATGRSFGDHRVVVKTVSGGYLSRDFVFEIDVTIPPDSHDLAYVGFGLGNPNPAYNSEPAGAFQFRIHNLPDHDIVNAAASLPASDSPAEAGPKVHAALTVLGHYRAGVKTTFRIERAGSRVTLSMPATAGASHTFDMSLLPVLFGDNEGYLFFGNSVEGTIFSNVRVKPRG
jgi:hypothetical protein